MSDSICEVRNRVNASELMHFMELSYRNVAGLGKAKGMSVSRVVVSLIYPSQNLKQSIY